MKKIITICLALLAAPLVANTVPLNVSSSAQDASPVNIAVNAPFGVGPDGRAHRFATDNSGNLVVSSSGNTSTPNAVIPLAPATGPFSLTLTGTTAWTYVNLTCSAQPCNVFVQNQSAGGEVLHYWLDGVTQTPIFSGYTEQTGLRPFYLDVVPGNKFHWFFSLSTGAGVLQNLSK